MLNKNSISNKSHGDYSYFKYNLKNANLGMKKNFLCTYI